MLNGIKRDCPMCDHPPGLHKCCPQCGESAEGADDIGAVFGFRAMKPEDKDQYYIPQTWCRKCRSDQMSEKRAKELGVLV